MLPILLSVLMLCSCSPTDTVSDRTESSIVTISETVSGSGSIVPSESKTYYENYYIALLSEIPADNGDEISYAEALKIGDRIYSGSKNKIISFKEDLSDLQVLYESPNTDLYYEQMMLFDKDTICVRFLNNTWSYKQEDSEEYIYMLIDLTNQSAAPFLPEIKGFRSPFKRLGDDYYLNLRRMDDYYDGSFEYDLYKMNSNGKDQLLMAGFNDMLIYKNGVYLIDYPEIQNNNYSTVYYFNFETQELNKILEIKNLNAFKISGDFILYSAGAYTQAYLYDITHKTTVFLNEKLGFEFNVRNSDVRNEHFFISVYHEDTGEHEISEINMVDLKITEADKMNLPGYIVGWKYYIIEPSESGDEEHEEEYYSLWRHDWNYEKQFVY